MNLIIKNAGGPYWNKGKQCYWIELHDGTTHKFVIDPDASDEEITKSKAILGEDDAPQEPKAVPLPPIKWL